MTEEIVQTTIVAYFLPDGTWRILDTTKEKMCVSDIVFAVHLTKQEVKEWKEGSEKQGLMRLPETIGCPSCKQSVRAKFVCNGVTKLKAWAGVKVPFLFNAEFSPVSNGSDENKRFFESTPSGKIEIRSVGDFFEPGKEYYIDFTEAE